MYGTKTQRIDGTLNADAIHNYVRAHPELKVGLNVMQPPRNINHTVNHEGTIHTIVATYPRSYIERSSSPPLRAYPS